MIANLEHLDLRRTVDRERVYSPDILPQLRSALADLADIDCAYQQNLDAIRRSPAAEELKGIMIEILHRQHRERRARYTQKLDALQKQITALMEKPGP